MNTLISLLLFSFTLFAHPHIFMDVYPKIKTDTVLLHWIFDGMSSDILIMIGVAGGLRIYLPRSAAAETIRFYDPENMTGHQVTEAFVKEANPGRSFAVHAHDFDYYYGHIPELR